MTDVNYNTWLGQRVLKRSGKPFKSTLKINTAAATTSNPHTGRLAFLFEEDESVVDAHICKLADPYIEQTTVVVTREYNPEFGDGRVCECGHPYYRHFDTYENMHACGCKYCECITFKEKTT